MLRAFEGCLDQTEHNMPLHRSQRLSLVSVSGLEQFGTRLPWSDGVVSTYEFF